MTNSEWLSSAREHADVLRSLIQQYHPATPDGPRRGIGPITAPGAEAACEVVRTKIASEHKGGHPVELFDLALEAGDISIINGLLNSAWFGVPESTMCWQIPGFKEAVDLMDDLPEGE